jgi:hypothetical protein
VKGQISFIVLCLMDSNDKIKSLTQLFFIELSKRSNNPVYNLLGDIIGTLSREEEEEEEKDKEEEVEGREGLTMKKKHLLPKEFQEIMTFVLSFVTKDK